MKPNFFLQKAILYLLLTALLGQASAQSIDTANYYQIINVMQGEKKSVTGMVNASLGNAVMLRGDINHAMQQWSLAYEGNGNYRFVNREHGLGFSLDVVNEGANSSRVTLARSNKLSGQYWKITKNLDGTFRIRSLWQGVEKSLDFVKDGDKMNELILLPTDANANNQKWILKGTPKPKPAILVPLQPEPIINQTLVDTSSVYRLTCQFRGEGLAMEAVSTDKGIRPMLKAVRASQAQLWKLVLNAQGMYRLVNQHFTNQSVDVINDGKLNYELRLATSGNFSGQYWRLSRHSDGTFRFANLWQATKSLDVLNSGSKDQLIVNASGNYSGQFWSLTKQSLSIVVEPSPSPALEPTPSVIVEPAPSRKNKLMPGEELLPEMKLVSLNGIYYLIQQKDGNLVLYNNNDQPIWASGMNGKYVQRCVMQADGNLVQYLPYKVATWATATHGNPGAYLILHDDGSLFINSKNDKRLWSADSGEK